MFCPKCGAQNSESTNFCYSCGSPLRTQGEPMYAQVQPQEGPLTPPLAVPNYLTQAILVTIFCCWPFGIPAIVNAARANSQAAAGNYEVAMEAAAKAKTWMTTSFICGLVIAVIYGIVILVGLNSH